MADLLCTESHSSVVKMAFFWESKRESRRPEIFQPSIEPLVKWFLSHELNSGKFLSKNRIATQTCVPAQTCVRNSGEPQTGGGPVAVQPRLGRSWSSQAGQCWGGRETLTLGLLVCHLFLWLLKWHLFLVKMVEVPESTNRTVRCYSHASPH